MNKTVIVNIAGAIFHIEEDAYDILKEYSNTIRSFFSRHEDGAEIVEDIESRIAELFAERLKSEEKEVVELQHVREVISRLGSVNDFNYEEEREGEPLKEPEVFNKEPGQPRRFCRNVRNRKIGGVCAGLGDWLNFDPVWVRAILFLLCWIWGMGVLLYLILWIVVPKAPASWYISLDESGRKRKRLYRDSRHKMVGGVFAGLGVYWNIDPTWLRLIWVLIVLGGFFGLIVQNGFLLSISGPIFFLYFVFWFIMPKTRSLADRMAMKGEPDNLDGIVRNAEEEKKIEQEGVSVLTVWINQFFNGIISFFKWILKFIGKIFGVALVLFPFLFIVGVVVMITIMLTLEGQFFTDVRFLTGFYEKMGIIASAVLLIVPALSLIFLGITIVQGKAFVNKWVMLVLWLGWFVALCGDSFILAKNVRELRTGTEVRELAVLDVPDSECLVLRVLSSAGEKIEASAPTTAGHTVTRISKDFPDTWNLRQICFSVRRSPDDSIRLLLIKEARGENAEQAVANSRKIDYTYQRSGNVISLEDSYDLEWEALWRGQRVRVVLEMPVGRKMEIVSVNYPEFKYDNYYLNSRGGYWLMTEEGTRFVKK